MNTMLNKSMNKIHEWLHKIQSLAGWRTYDEGRALAFLRATLHELRDNSPIENLAHFSTQLPLIARGLLFEEWVPSRPLLRERKREEFLYGVYSHLPDVYQPDLYQDEDPETAVLAVLQTLMSKMDINEILKLQKVLPHGIRELFTAASEGIQYGNPPYADEEL